MLALWVLNPPVGMVEKAWQMESNKGIPPTNRKPISSKVIKR
jgi:hypothetical protein